MKKQIEEATVPVLTPEQDAELAATVLRAIRILMTCNVTAGCPYEDILKARRAAYALRDACDSIGQEGPPPYTLDSPYFNICKCCYCDLTDKDKVGLTRDGNICGPCVVDMYPFLQVK
jgi:hypothetical protein